MTDRNELYRRLYLNKNITLSEREMRYVCRSYQCLPLVLKQHRSVTNAIISRGYLHINLRKRFGQYVLNELVHEDHMEGMYTLLHCEIGADFRYGANVLGDVLKNAILKRYFSTARLLTGYGAVLHDSLILHNSCITLRSLKFILKYYRGSVDINVMLDDETPIERLCRKYESYDTSDFYTRKYCKREEREQYRSICRYGEIDKLIGGLLDNGADISRINITNRSKKLRNLFTNRERRNLRSKKETVMLHQKQVFTLLLIFQFGIDDKESVFYEDAWYIKDFVIDAVLSS